MSCLGLVNSSKRDLRETKIAIEKSPIRPANIVKIIITLPKNDKSCVTPTDKPTVPKAEKTSYPKSITLHFPPLSAARRTKNEKHKINTALTKNKSANLMLSIETL